MKYRVHSFQVVRVSYEVEANSTIEAKGMVDAGGDWMLPIVIGDIPSEEWTKTYIVDPLLPNGEVDYDNVTHFDDIEKPMKLGPKKHPDSNFFMLRRWHVAVSPLGEYLYVKRLGKPGDIHLKAEDEGFVVDMWNDSKDCPECIDSMMVGYEDLTPYVDQEPPPPVLEDYIVSLHEEKGDKFTILFNCWAEDADHAAEQALNAYPQGEVINCTINM